MYLKQNTQEQGSKIQRCLSYKKHQRGLGLPATIFLIVILSLIVLAMGDLTEQSNLGFGQDYQSLRAFYAAESGAQVALNRVFVGGTACDDAALVDIDFDSAGSNPGLDDCTTVLACSSIVVDVSTYMTFVSTATCGSSYELATRSIEVRAKL